MTNGKYQNKVPDMPDGHRGQMVNKYLINLMVALVFLLGITAGKAWAYPSSYGMENSFEWITQVTFSNMVSNTGRETGGHTYYSGLTATVSKGTSYTLSVTIEPDANEYISVWIDWNQDDNWGETEQYILATSTSSPGPHSQSITIPATAVTGTVRMRVSLKYDGMPTYNEEIEYGEVEDYNVQVQDTGDPDSTAPGQITDLAVTAVAPNSVALIWTAPGDDGSNGTAAAYNVRYATFVINDTNWASATAAVSEPSPQIAGSLQSFIVTGLNPGTSYYFAIKSTDEAANESVLSNIVTATTTSMNFCGNSNLVMVTGDGGFGIRYDAQKRALFESWGYTVTAIWDEAGASTFTSAAAANDVMYISESVGSWNIDTKARDLDIGIVVEEVRVLPEMAFITIDNGVNALGDHIVIQDNSHYITSGFSLGNLTVYNTPDLIWGNDTTWATGGRQLARTPVYSPTIYAFETGDSLVSGYSAANRRVSSHFWFDTNPTIWHDNLKTLLWRSLQWAANCDTVSTSSIRGRIFEDIGYGGGDGRSFTNASAVGRSGVTVEIYNSAGGYIGSDSTDTNGNYSFSGLTATSYTVRVVNSTVTSSLSGANGSEAAVQTYRVDGPGESAGTGSSKVGGEQPQNVDAPANSGAQTLATLQLLSGQYTQSMVSVDASGGNISNVDFGFNFNSIVNTNDSGQGSLRQFILNANLLGGTQTSQFMIPTSDTNYNRSANGEFTIIPTTALPAFSAPLILDGTTQTSNMGDTNINGPEIELDGNLAGDVEGIMMWSGSAGSTVRGLVINQFSRDGIDIETNNNVIQGNYIGTDVTGTSDQGNGSDGINVYGGVSNLIGGATPGAGNLISGNDDDGITLTDGSDNCIIQGNLIGTNALGTGPLGNSDQGIVVYDYSHNNTIGGLSTDETNIIAYNGDRGLKFFDSLNNTILGNAIFANVGIGIDLNPDSGLAGVTTNDVDDDDTGANDLLNFPVITSATVAGGTTNIGFDLDVPAGTYRIEFFKNPSGADPSGYGEGESLAGDVSIVHLGGNQSFSHSFSGTAGDILTATATVDASGNFGSTSEFSAVFTATAAAPDIRISKDVALISDPFNNTTNPKSIPGSLLTYTVTTSNHGLVTPDSGTVIITSPIGSNATLFVGDLSGTGSAVIFQDGSPASGLSFSSGQIAYSNNNGSSFVYTPPNGVEFDPSVTHIRVVPSGSFNASDGSNHPSFTLQYRVRVK